MQNKTVIHGMDELAQFENTDHLDIPRSGDTCRVYEVKEVVNNRLVILLGNYSEHYKGEWYTQTSGKSVKVKGMSIVAPEGTQITIIGGEKARVDCRENDVRFYKSGDIVTRHNTGVIHAKGCKDVTAHQNNKVIATQNGSIYAKWNNEVDARGNREIHVSHNTVASESNNDRVNEGSGGKQGFDCMNNRPDAKGLPLGA